MEDLSVLVQVGVVTAVNGRHARVKFPESDEPSGWLTVLRAPVAVRTENASGGSGETAFASHSHGVQVSPWTPKVNDWVLVLYRPIPGGEGYIIGGI